MMLLSLLLASVSFSSALNTALGNKQRIYDIEKQVGSSSSLYTNRACAWFLRVSGFDIRYRKLKPRSKVS